MRLKQAVPEGKEGSGERDGDRIVIRVEDSTRRVFAFKVRPGAEVAKVISAYAKQADGMVSSNKIRLVFEGRTLQPDETLKSVGISDGSTLEVFSSQLGG